MTEQLTTANTAVQQKYRFGQTNALGPRINAAAQEIHTALANNTASMNEEQQAQLRQKMRQQAEEKQHVVTAAEARKLEVQKEHQKLYEKLMSSVQEDLRELYNQEVKAEVWAKADEVKREMRQQLAEDLTNEVKEELRAKLRAEIQRELPSKYAEEVAQYRKQVKERVERTYPPLLKAELKAKLEPEIEPEIVEALRAKLEPGIAEELRYTLKPGIIEAVKTEVRAELYSAAALREEPKPSLPQDDVKDESLFVSESDLSDLEGGNALERQQNEDANERSLGGERYTTWPPLDENFDHEPLSHGHAGIKRSRHINTKHDGHYFDRDEARFNGQYESGSDDEEGSTGVRSNADAYHGMKRPRLAGHGPSNRGRDIQAAREHNGGATTHILGESPVKPVSDFTRRAAKRTRHELDSEDEDSDDYGMSKSLCKRINQQYLAGAFAGDSDAPDDGNLVKDETLSTNDEVLREDHWKDLGDDLPQADDLSDDSEEEYGEDVNIGVKETFYPSHADDPSDMSEEGYDETGEADVNIGVKSSETYPPSTDSSSGVSEQEYGSDDESEEDQEYDDYGENEDENVGNKASEAFHTSQIDNLRGSSKDNAIDLGDSDSDGETQLGPNHQTMGSSSRNLGLSYGYSSSDGAQSHDSQDSHDGDGDAMNVNLVQEAHNDLPDYNPNPAVFQEGSLMHSENLALAKAARGYVEQAQENGDDEGYDDEDTLVEDAVAMTVVKTIKQGRKIVEDIDVTEEVTIIKQQEGLEDVGANALVKNIQQEEEL